MSDFGNLTAYIAELEAEVPPATLMAMKTRPATLPPIPEPASRRAEPVDDKSKR